MVAPPPKARRVPAGARITPLFGHDLVGRINFDPARLTPDTSPEAIAADQRAALVAAGAWVATDPAALSDAADLPVWTVVRRLEELGLREPVPGGEGRDRVRTVARKTTAEAREWLARHGPGTLRDIMRGIGRRGRSVASALTEANGFRPVGTRKNARGNAVTLWAAG